METGEIVQMVRCLLCKHEALGSTLRVHIKKPGMVARAVIPVPRRQRQEGPWGPLASNLAYLAGSLLVRLNVVIWPSNIQACQHT